MIDYSIIEGGINSINAVGNELIYGNNNLNQDPLFADATNGDYTLLSGSPAINAGSPNAFYNDNDGTRNDMGYTGGNGITLSATEIDFGYLGVGDSRNKTLTITNAKDSDISVSSSSFDDAQFSTSSSFPVTVAAYSAADITLTFTPSATGANCWTCSARLMPNPIQTGSGVCSLSQPTVSTRSGGRSLRSPVIPVTET